MIFIEMIERKKNEETGRISQVKHYDSSKRRYHAVYAAVNDRKRAVERTFGSNHITAVTRRVVSDTNR